LAAKTIKVKRKGRPEVSLSGQDETGRRVSAWFQERLKGEEIGEQNLEIAQKSTVVFELKDGTLKRYARLAPEPPGRPMMRRSSPAPRRIPPRSCGGGW